MRGWDINTKEEATTVIKLFEENNKTDIEKVYRELQNKIIEYKNIISKTKVRTYTDDTDAVKRLINSVEKWERECNQINKSYQMIYKKSL